MINPIHSLPSAKRPNLSDLWRGPKLRLLALCLVASGCGDNAANLTLGGSGDALTLERLYSLPNLIGNTPRGFAWAADSSRVAFLWNDQGYNFRDVWVADVESAEPVRWTDLGHISQVAPIGHDRPKSSDPGHQNGDWRHSEQAYNAAVELEEREQAQGATEVRWHPDGARIVLSLDGDLWIASRGQAPSPFIADASQAVFSPSGNAVAFLRSGDLWMAGADGRDVRRLTALADDARRLSSFEWSPTGDRFAILFSDASGVTVRGIPDYLAEETALRSVRRAYPGEEPVRQRLGFVNAASTRSPTEVDWLQLATPAPDMLLSYGWSPDGRSIAVDTSDLYAKDRRIYVANFGTQGASVPDAEVRLVARDEDPFNETFYFWRIEWSHNSEYLHFLSDRKQDYHVWSVPRRGGEPRRLTEGDWAVSEMTSTSTGLVVVGNRGRPEERHVFSVAESLATQEEQVGSTPRPLQLSVRAGTHAPVVAPDGRWAAVLHSADDSPPDLLFTDLTAGSERQVTQSRLAEFGQFDWVTPQYVDFSSHIDGTPLAGRLTLPPNFDPSKRYPAILGSVYTDSVRNQWGGRTAHPTWGLDQFLAQQGYVLLNVDMRGSWGRGREHRRGIRLDYGGIDIDDLESGVRFLGSLGYVDLERVGIWGSSYGGLMTAMSMFRKPGLYAAGVAGAPATNVGHALTGQMAVMLRPQDQPLEYADSSPFLHGHGLEGALMIIHGMRDGVVLYKDSVVLTQRLLQMGKDVDLVTLPNAGHGWDNEGLAQTRFAFRKLVAHFDRHLQQQSMQQR